MRLSDRFLASLSAALPLLTREVNIDSLSPSCTVKLGARAEF